MGKINKFNYYSVQDLSFSRQIIKTMLTKRKKLKTIYTFLRNEARWDSIGDYPLISFICKVAKENGYDIKQAEIRNMFRKTTEFEKVKQNSEIILQVYAQIIAQNALQRDKEVKTTKDTFKKKMANKN